LKRKPPFLNTSGKNKDMVMSPEGAEIVSDIAGEGQEYFNGLD
jgi:hypothetical protein